MLRIEGSIGELVKIIHLYNFDFESRCFAILFTTIFKSLKEAIHYKSNTKGNQLVSIEKRTTKLLYIYQEKGNQKRYQNGINFIPVSFHNEGDMALMTKFFCRTKS